MIYPQHDELSKDYPYLSAKAVLEAEGERTRKLALVPAKPTPWAHQCSARAAQNIEGHHRPVIASIFPWFTTIQNRQI